MNDIDPQAWFADVLARIAEHPAHQLDELLPWNWATENGASIRPPEQPCRGAHRMLTLVQGFRVCAETLPRFFRQRFGRSSSSFALRSAIWPVMSLMQFWLGSAVLYSKCGTLEGRAIDFLLSKTI